MKVKLTIDIKENHSDCPNSCLQLLNWDTKVTGKCRPLVKRARVYPFQRNVRFISIIMHF